MQTFVVLNEWIKYDTKRKILNFENLHANTEGFHRDIAITLIIS